MVQQRVKSRGLIRERCQTLTREGGEFDNVQYRLQLGSALVGETLRRSLWSGRVESCGSRGERRSGCAQRARDHGKEDQHEENKPQRPGARARRGRDRDLAIEGLHLELIPRRVWEGCEWGHMQLWPESLPGDAPIGELRKYYG